MLADGPDVNLVRGDDYAAQIGRALVWSVATTLDLSGASIRFAIYRGVVREKGYPILCTLAAIPDGYTFWCKLTAAQTAALPPWRAMRYEVEATLSSGHVVTLVRGKLEATGTVPGDPQS